MSTISIQDINKLRIQTGAGLTDCKKALQGSGGDFEKAIDYLRKKGKKIAAARVDREAIEGAVLAGISADKKVGYLLCLACETDFVSKNDDFVAFAQTVLDIAISNNIETLDQLVACSFSVDEGVTIQQKIDEMVGKIGEKIYFSKYELVEADLVVTYIHGVNRLGVLVGLNSTSDMVEEVGKNIAMQIAAMNPIAIDADGIDADLLKREEAVIKEQMKADPRMSSKPEAIIEKIAIGKLNSFLKENILLSQSYVKDTSQSVDDYIKSADSNLKLTGFKRVALG